MAELADAGLGWDKLLFLLSVDVQSIPAGTACAVWTAIGASVVVLLRLLFLGEPANCCDGQG